MNGSSADDLDAWHTATIEQGLRDADAGRLVAHQGVVAWVES